jgi:hypothetical protein
VHDIAILAADTGLRPNSELFLVRWANVHLDACVEGPHGFIHVPSGKTDAARRNVPLTPRARAVLEMRKAATGGSAYVFPGPGTSGHITTVQHAHERTIERANEKAREQGREKSVIEPFEFYCWRHTCGTRWAEAGLDTQSIHFHYIKSQFVRTVHADGAIGGITPHADIIVNFYSERQPIPKMVTQELKSDMTLGQEFSKASLAEASWTRTKARSAASYSSLRKPSPVTSISGGDSHDAARGTNSRGGFVVRPLSSNLLMVFSEVW